MGIREDGFERAAVEAARVALERAGARSVNLGVTAPGFVRAVHPVHGEPVVFVPGELLPDWAAEALRLRSGSFDAAGVFVLGGLL